MLPSVHAFLNDIIDYAGLFPPADLPFPQAMANYLRYRQDPERWMLARFVCPAARLGELAAFRDEIGRGGKDGHENFASFKKDVGYMVELGRMLGNDAIIENYEIKFATVPSKGCLAQAGEFGRFAAILGAFSMIFERYANLQPTVFVE